MRPSSYLRNACHGETTAEADILPANLSDAQVDR